MINNNPYNCFFNSILYFIIKIPNLVDNLNSFVVSKKKFEEKNYLQQYFLILLNNVFMELFQNYSMNESENLKNLRFILSIIGDENFKLGKFEEAHLFLFVVLNILRDFQIIKEKFVNVIKKKINNNKNIEFNEETILNNNIHNIFYFGEGNIYFKKLLKESFKNEVNELNVNNFVDKGYTIDYFLDNNIPNYFIFFINKNEDTINDNITNNFNINIKFYKKKVNDLEFSKKINYSLISILEFYGDENETSHYITYLLQNNSWYYFNDLNKNSYKVKEDKIRKNGLIFLYVKK